MDKIQNIIGECRSYSNIAYTHTHNFAQLIIPLQVLPLSIQHIHQNYDKPLTVAQLAALEGYTLTYYSEWFKKITSQTPQSYIQKVRLDKAKELLRHTNLSILHIAIQVGYQHQGSLTRLFQQYVHITPATYRRTFQK